MIRYRLILVNLIIFLLLGGAILFWKRSTQNNSVNRPLPYLQSDTIFDAPYPTSSKIDFRSLVQGVSTITNLDPLILLVVGTSTEMPRLIKQLDPETVREIQMVDVSTMWIVAVFSGKLKNSTHLITIKTISFSSKTVQVTVELTGSVFNQNGMKPPSYSYHIVLIPKQQLSVPPGTIWLLKSADGQLLAQIRYPQ